MKENEDIFVFFSVFKFSFPQEYELGVKIPTPLLSPTNLKLSLNASEIAQSSVQLVHSQQGLLRDHKVTVLCSVNTLVFF